MVERKFTESRLEEPTTQSSIQARQEDLGVVEQPVDNLVEQTTTQVTDAEVERATDSLESGVDRLIGQQEVKAPEIEPVQAPTEDVQVEQLKQEEPKIEPIKPVKAPKIEPVQDVQVVESNKLTNESNREKLELQKEQKATTQFTQMLTSGATNEELADFVNSNPQFKKSFNSIARDTFKTRANAQFFSQYNGMSNEAMDAAVKEGKLVPGSNQYNLLSEQQRARYEAYAKREEAITLPQKTDFTSGDNVQSLEGILAEVQKLFSTNLRDKSKELFNSPAIQEATSAISSKKLEIEELDIKLEDIEDEMRKKLGDDGFSPAYINSAIRDEKNALIKEKRLLVAEYNSRLGEYQNLKSDAQQELEFYKYEDAQAKQVYNTALGLYESRRKEALSVRSAAEEREFEIKKLEFIEENRRLAEDRGFENQKALTQFNAKLRQEDLSGGKYIDDGKGNIQYVKNGEVISVLEGLGETKSVSQDSNYSYSIKQNDDGTYTVFGLPKKDGLNVYTETFDIEGDPGTNYVNNIGSGQITSYGGEHDGFQGLDIDGSIGDPITTPLAGKVVEAMSHKLYGNTILVEFEDGNQARYSHLDKPFVSVGDEFGRGSVIGTLGNTGNVLKMDGTKPSREELKKGFGSHLDLVTYDKNGRPRNAKETEKYLSSIGQGADLGYSDADIPLYKAFNSEKGLTTAEINTIDDFESFKEEARLYGEKLAQPGYERINDLINLADSLRDLGPLDRKLPDNAVDFDRLLSKAGMSELVNLKQQGATFGALSEKEFERIQASILTVGPLTSADKWNNILDDYVRDLKRGLPEGYEIQQTPKQVSGSITTPTGFTFDYTKANASTQARNSSYSGFFNE